MSVWQSIDALFEFTYKSAHTEVFRRRHECFDSADGAHLVLGDPCGGFGPAICRELNRALRV